MGTCTTQALGGVIDWETYIGAVLDYGPFVGVDNIYLSFADNTIRAYTVASGSEVWRLQLDAGSAFCLAHDRLYVVSDGELRCYE